MKVADVMTRELITINANERARNALRLMEKEGVSRLLVEKKKKIVGIVTLRDLMRRLGSEKERKISDAHIFVSSCYSKDLIKISPQESIEKAAKMMIDNGISSLVVEENGEVVGIVTKTDLLKVLKNDSTPVKEIMQKKVRTIQPDGSLLQARKMMLHYGIKRLVVTKDGRIVGIVTESDIANALGLFRKLVEGKHWDEKMKEIRVEDVMSRDVKCVGPSTSLSACVRMMEEYGISGLPVVEGDRLVGIVTKTDLVKYITTKK